MTSKPASSTKVPTTTPSTKLESLFEEVAQLIRETPVTRELDTASTDDKLRLYGL